MVAIMISIRRFHTSPILVHLVMAVALTGWDAYGQIHQRGSLKYPIIDSAMTEKEAFDGLDPKCPDDIRRRQRLINVKYYSTDGRVHQGQLVLDAALVDDVKRVFALALKERFPVRSVIPISDRRFRKDGRWDDELSMEADNTSAFNYREITGGGRLSNHAYGRAVDINTFENPYIKGGTVLPRGATYDPKVPGTFTAESSVVREFLRLGWAWGGNWTDRKDYQHFEKPPKR
jgi:peptidoglycan L-alanyl-D-glutamate endopeptidase CwlK